MPEYTTRRQFNPVDYDPAEWVRLAKQAGMRYITITSTHHDGFAMWDSDVSDYTQSWGVMTRTPTTLYVHVLEPATTKLVLPRTQGLDVKKATLFGTDREVAITTGPDGELELFVPSDAVHPIDTTIVLGL